MIQTVKQVALGVIAALSVLALVMVAQETHENVAEAIALEVGVDVNTSGNDATTIGTVDTCRTVNFFTTFDIDIYFQNGISNLIAADLWFQYDPTKLQIQGYTFMFQDDPPNSDLADGSELLPDTFEPGYFHIGAVENGESQGDTGLEGVLFRLSVKAIGNGLSPAKISKIDWPPADGIADRGITLKNASNISIGDTADADPFYDGTVVNSVVSVGGGSCTATDSDGDGITDIFDNCPATANPLQEDWNFDGIGDVCQDFDGDLVGDDTDNCPGVSNPLQEDQDSDGIGDACDNDSDGDGVANTVDNCPNTSNASQSDLDGDGDGDACDTDIDGDGWPNEAETSLTTNAESGCGVNAFPPDFDDNTDINILDVLSLKPVFLHSAGDGIYVVRKDIAPKTGPDNVINILDVIALKPYFLTSCAGP